MKKILLALVFSALFLASATATTFDMGTLHFDSTAVSGEIASLTITGALTVDGSSNQLIFEGATADAYETIITATDPTADIIYTLPNVGAGTYSLMSSTLATNALDIANSVWGASNSFVFEGATADAYETSLSPDDPTADRTITIPNDSGSIVLTSQSSYTMGAANSVYGGSNAWVFEGATSDDYETSIAPTDPTADRTITLPDSTGTVRVTSYTESAANSIYEGTNTWVFEGATADDYETSLSPTDPTADRTITLPDITGTVMLSSFTPSAANSVYGGTNTWVFEGATADDYETSITPTDPTADRTFTLPNLSGIAVVRTAAAALTPGGAVSLTVGTGNQIFTDTPTDNEDQTITFSGAGNEGDEVTIIFTTAGTADEIITFHATLVSSTGTLTLGTTAGKYYVVKFVSNGSHWYEVSRTAEQT